MVLVSIRIETTTESIRRKDKNSLSNTLGYKTVFIDYVHVRPKRNGRMCAYCEGR